MSLEFYKILHLGGFACLFIALGGMACHAMASHAQAAAGGEGVAPQKSKLWGPLHGIGLVLLLVAGFGAMAKLGIKAPPGWVWGKLVLWLLLGASPALFKRAPQFAKGVVFALPFFALAAATLAVLKPGG